MKTFCIDKNSMTVIMISFLVSFKLSMEVVLIFEKSFKCSIASNAKNLLYAFRYDISYQIIPVHCLVS